MLPKSIYTATPQYYHSYLNLVESEDFMSELFHSKDESLHLFKSIKLHQENYAYDSGKWTVKEVLQHIIDTERIFAYRALRFSRKDNTVLQGFDENLFINQIDLRPILIQNLISEYEAVRNSSIALFKNMTDEMLDYQGRVGENTFSSKVLSYLIIGHNLHHLTILKERYF